MSSSDHPPLPRDPTEFSLILVSKQIRDFLDTLLAPVRLVASAMFYIRVNRYFPSLSSFSLAYLPSDPPRSLVPVTCRKPQYGVSVHSDDSPARHTKCYNMLPRFTSYNELAMVQYLISRFSLL